jgi:hypothetical protein
LNEFDVKMGFYLIKYYLLILACCDDQTTKI